MLESEANWGIRNCNSLRVTDSHLIGVKWLSTELLSISFSIVIYEVQDTLASSIVKIMNIYIKFQ